MQFRRAWHLQKDCRGRRTQSANHFLGRRDEQLLSVPRCRVMIRTRRSCPMPLHLFRRPTAVGYDADLILLPPCDLLRLCVIVGVEGSDDDLVVHCQCGTDETRLRRSVLHSSASRALFCKDAWTASAGRIFGVSAEMSTPVSFMTSTTTGLTM